jgi:hypothetical protein
MSGHLHALATLAPVPIGKQAGWALEPVWTLMSRESFTFAENQTKAIQTIANRYTTELFWYDFYVHIYILQKLIK